MQQYHELLNAILEKGTYKAPARSNMPGTTSLFGYQFRHDLSKFPLLTTKKMYWKGVVIELLWFLKGDTNVKFLIDNGVNIWNQDAYNFYVKKHKECYGAYTSPSILKFDEFEDLIKYADPKIFVEWFESDPEYRLGDCGFQYGKVWRNWQNVDQIKNVIQSLRKNPESRRHIVTATDPAHDTDLALYWCHSMFQFNCRPITDQPNKYYLDCQLYQRSADVFLGVPFNIASYALLTTLIAKLTNMIPGEFIHTFGDVHIYDNHKEAVATQLTRDCNMYELPTVKIANLDLNKDIDQILQELKYEDFELLNYQSYPAIKAELSTGLVVA